MYWILRKTEKLVDDLILPSLIVVAVVVVAGLFLPDVYKEYKSVFSLVDNVAIGIFAVDLAFKTYRASNWEDFLREHWLEIIAIMPAFVVYRVLEGIFLAIDYVEKGQHIAHLVEGVRSGRLTKVFRGGKLARAERLSIALRSISRSPRIAKATEFYESPRHNSIFSNGQNKEKD